MMAYTWPQCVRTRCTRCMRLIILGQWALFALSLDRRHCLVSDQCLLSRSKGSSNARAPAGACPGGMPASLGPVHDVRMALPSLPRSLPQAKSDLDSKKVKLAKLRGTPGLKEDKIAEAERDVNEADQRLRSAKLG